jgi:23S rRNA pseudouridine2605 synthase
MSTEKLQKILAHHGLGSRRQMEQWITDGRVEVNDEVASLGDRVSTVDKIKVDGKPLKQQDQRTRVLMLNKEEGVICTRHDPKGRPTIFDKLPSLSSGRWLNVGRLDINSSGLLLLTNDGDLVERLTHPRFRVIREYAVRVYGRVSDEKLSQLIQGVQLDDGMARFEKIESSGGDGRNQWYRVRLREGRNREVRRMWEAVDCTVSRLLRTRFGPILLPRDLPPGAWRECPAKLVASLSKSS